MDKVFRVRMAAGSDCNPHDLLQDLNLAKLPPIQEIKEAFDKNTTWLQSQLR